MILCNHSRNLFFQSQQWEQQDNVGNLFKVNTEDSRSRFGVFIVNFEQISQISLVNDVVLMSLLLTLNKFHALLTLNKLMMAGICLEEVIREN